MSSEVVYLDASAAIKLVRNEPETAALVEVIGAEPAGVSSHLIGVELWCFVHRVEPGARQRVVTLVEQLDLLPQTEAVLRRACEPFDPPQAALDAIHLATALDLDLPELLFLSYHERQLDGARNAGLTVASPGA